MSRSVTLLRAHAAFRTPPRRMQRQGERNRNSARLMGDPQLRMKCKGIRNFFSDKSHLLSLKNVLAQRQEKKEEEMGGKNVYKYREKASPDLPPFSWSPRIHVSQREPSITNDANAWQPQICARDPCDCCAVNRWATRGKILVLLIQAPNCRCFLCAGCPTDVL